MGRLEAGEADRQGIQNQFVEAQQIDFGGSGPWEGCRLGRQGVPGRGKAGGWESPRRESKINLLRLNKLILVVPGRGKAGIQNQFVEAQQIDFWRLGGRGVWVVGRLEAGEAADRESKINLLRLNKLILVVPGRGKAGGWGGRGFRVVGRLEAGSHRAGNPKSIS